MKTVTVKNPDKNLRSVMTNITEKWVQTCHTDTCGCMSHDPGYMLVTGQVPDDVEVREVGESVHSHPQTVTGKSLAQTIVASAMAAEAEFVKAGVYWDGTPRE